MLFLICMTLLGLWLAYETYEVARLCCPGSVSRAVVTIVTGVILGAALVGAYQILAPILFN